VIYLQYGIIKFISVTLLLFAR